MPVRHAANYREHHLLPQKLLQCHGALGFRA